MTMNVERAFNTRLAILIADSELLTDDHNVSRADERLDCRRPTLWAEIIFRTLLRAACQMRFVRNADELMTTNSSSGLRAFASDKLANSRPGKFSERVAVG